MSITVVCDCGKKLTAPDSAANKRGRCPNCGSVLLLPAISGSVEASLDEVTKEWMSSPAHLLFLSRFQKGDSPEKYRDAAHWEAALGQQPQSAIKDFVQSNALEPAGLFERIDYKFKATDLKALLKARNAKVSGRKEELVQRLIEIDSSGMEEATQHLDIFRCTPFGSNLSEQFVVKENERRASAEAEVLSHLQSGRLSNAVQAVAIFESTQVFARGIGIDWKRYDVTSGVESLKSIFERTPTILNGIQLEPLVQLRVAAAMMQLWGTSRAQKWLPPDFETGIRFDGDVACRMLVFHASHLRNLVSLREAGAKTVEVLGTEDGMTCPECRKLNGKKYKLKDVPEFPFANCTCEIGCRCTVVVHGFD